VWYASPRTHAFRRYFEILFVWRGWRSHVLLYQAISSRMLLSALSLQGEKARVGIGAYFQRDKDIDSVLSVKSLLKGSPAQQCNKIAVGDHIMAVNGASVESFSLAELAEKLLGPTGSVVECTFARRGTNERYAVSLTRGINSDKWSVASRNK
jgi:C-terminal processing protease CtpA/Prc